MTAVDRLSPSKINAFRDCPRHFAFRYVERLEEPEDPYLLRGTLVHAVCERLFDLPPEERTRAAAIELLHRLWEGMVDQEPGLAELFADAAEATAWAASAERLLITWFRLESPSRLPVAGTEVFVETADGDGILAGIIDRLDELPDGTWAITDYKTGPAPRPRWERSAFFQLRFYAWVVRRSLGIDVSRLRLVHLAGDGEVLELDFDAEADAGVGHQIAGLGSAMRRAFAAGEWRTNPGRRCDWCAFKGRCPAWLDPSEIVTNDDVAHAGITPH